MKKFQSFFYTALVVLGFTACKQDGGSATLSETLNLKTNLDSISYIAGTSTARNLKQSGLDTINPVVFAQAMQAVYAGKESALSEDAIKSALGTFQKFAEGRRKQQGVDNLAKSDKFLADNKSKEGVQEHSSGVQYKILTEGTGEVIGETDGIVVHYTGKFMDGKTFDTSVGKEPFTVSSFDGVIKGWAALKGMKVGTKCELVIPPSEAYGEMGQGPIPPNSALVFEIEILGKAKGQSPDPIGGQQ